MSPSTPSLSPLLNLFPPSPRALSPLSTAFLPRARSRGTPNRSLTPLSAAFTQTHRGVRGRLRSFLATRLPRSSRGHSFTPIFEGSLATFIRPLFSYSYELLFPQALYFDNHPHCRGVWGLDDSAVPPLEVVWPGASTQSNLPSVSLAVHFRPD